MGMEGSLQVLMGEIALLDFSEKTNPMESLKFLIKIIRLYSRVFIMIMNVLKRFKSATIKEEQLKS